MNKKLGTKLANKTIRMNKLSTKQSIEAKFAQFSGTLQSICRATRLVKAALGPR